MTDLDVLSNRIQTLEKRFRWIKILSVFGCIVLAAFQLTAQQRPGPQRRSVTEEPLTELQRRPSVPVEAEVRAQHFILVDENRKERASLAADRAGSVFLVMFDAAGKTRANISVTPDGPAVILFDPSGQARTVLGSTTLVPSHVNENGIVERGPASSLVLFDKNGKLLYREP
jgi:hypothetical protein